MENIVKDGQGFHDFKKKSDPKTFHYDFYKYVKSFGDIYFWPKGNFHVVTKASLAKEALTNFFIIFWIYKSSCDFRMNV